MPVLVPDSFLAFDEANSYLDKQQRSLDYLDRIQKLTAVTKTSIDIKNTNGYNRAAYINKLNHLSKLPTTSIVLTKSALKEHVGKPISIAEFKDLADELNSDDDNMQVEVGVLIKVESKYSTEEMRKILRKFWEQGNAINGAWKAPIVSSEDTNFVNMSISLSEPNDTTNDRDEDLYKQVKKLTNDPEYEKQIDIKIEEAYANKLHSSNKEKSVDYIITVTKGLLIPKEAREINSMLHAIQEGTPVILPNTVDGLNNLLANVNLYKDSMASSTYSDRDSVDELIKHISQINEHTRVAQHNIDIIRGIFHTNTASFVSTTTTNTTTTVPEKGR